MNFPLLRRVLWSVLIRVGGIPSHITPPTTIVKVPYEGGILDDNTDPELEGERGQAIIDHPDFEAYKPLLRPWMVDPDYLAIDAKFRPYTLVAAKRSYVLYRLAQQVRQMNGEIWECGVYRGGTSALLALAAPEKTLRMFDTFEGMPAPNPEHNEFHAEGDMNNTNVEEVQHLVPKGHIYKGIIPATFAGLEDCRIALAHIDVDSYQSVIDCCEFIYPRMVLGGVMVFDDYGFRSCMTARRAVDEFFDSLPEVPILFNTGHAIVIKL